MKMTLTHNGHRATLRYTENGERLTREFWTRGDGSTGYVHEVCGSGTKQVCERLAHMGVTLMATDATLADVIRREYRAMKRADKRREAAEA